MGNIKHYDRRLTVFKNFLQKINLKYVVILFVSVLVLLIMFCVNLTHNGYSIADNPTTFNKQSYLVKNAVSEFNFKALEVARTRSEFRLNKSTQPELKSILNTKVNSLDSLYLVIKNNYLGNANDTRALWDSYQSFREYIYSSESIEEGYFSNSEEINAILLDVEAKLEPIKNYIESRVFDNFDQEESSEVLVQHKLMQLYILIILLFVIGLFLAFYIFVDKNFSLLSEQVKFKKSIELAPYPIIIHKNGIITDISKEWEIQTGYSKNEIPTLLEWSKKAYGEDETFTQEFIDSFYSLENLKDDGIWKVTSKEGKVLIWRFKSGPLNNGYVFSTAVDITKEYKNQQEIEGLYKEKLKLSMAVDQSPVSIVITDLNGKIEYVNNYFTELTGYSFNEVLGKNPNILRSGAQSKDFYKNLWETIKNGNTWRGDFQNKNKDGDIFWEQASISPIIDDKGDVINYVAVKENITEKKQALEALEQSEKKYKDLFVRSTDACLILKDGIYIDCNDAALTKLGMSHKGELIGRRPSDIAPEYQPDGSKSAEKAEEIIKLSDKKKHYRFEWLHKKVNGELTPSEITLTKIEDGDGGRFYVVWRDISERKKFQQELIESEQKLKAITDNIEGVLLRFYQYKDGSSKINYVTKGVNKLFGLTQDQILENSSILFNQIAKDDLERVIEMFRSSAKNLSVWNCKFKIITSDNSVKWVRGTGVPLNKPEEGAIIWDTIVTDITEQIELENKVNEQLDEKTVLLSEIHHRVKNNLAVISGMLELQAFSSENAKAKNELMKSVNRIKSFAIIHEQIYESGNFASINIAESIKTLVNYLSTIYKKQDVVFDFNLDPITLNVNQAIPFALLVNELLMNAFFHAFKGIEEPKIYLSISKKNDRCYFTYHDNGIGFDVSKHDNTNISMGQNLIEAFVKQLKGILHLDSKPNAGAKIVLEFEPSLKKGASLNTNVD